MKLLAIDTSTEACSAALYDGGRVYVRYRMAPREHSHLILPMMEQVLAEAGVSMAQLDALAFGRGPGAFTGVRIAAGTIQGVALGSDLPVVPVSSLAALAQAAAQTSGCSYVLSAIDARMQEVYWGVFALGARDLVEPMGEEQVSPPGRLTVPAAPQWYGVGSGWSTYEPVLRARVGANLIGVSPSSYPSAAEVALLAVQGYERGEATTPEKALPVYLRDEVVAKKPGN